MKDKSVLKKQEQAGLIWGYNLIYNAKVKDELSWCRLWNAFYSELLKESNEDKNQEKG